jgi:Protein of unknown function (DUF3567)
MQMLYNSESFAVVQFEVPSQQVLVSADPAQAAAVAANGDFTLTRGGYEIVDKFARKEIFIEGAMAESFKQGVDALILTEPSEEEMDEYIDRFSSLMQQPVVLH